MMAIYGMIVWAVLMTVAVICLGMMVRDLQYAYRYLSGVRQLDLMRMRGQAVEDLMTFTSDDPLRQAAWDQSQREEVAMCGVCGKNVPLMPDRFTLSPHDCDVNQRYSTLEERENLIDGLRS